MPSCSLNKSGHHCILEPHETETQSNSSLLSRPQLAGVKNKNSIKKGFYDLVVQLSDGSISFRPVYGLDPTLAAFHGLARCFLFENPWPNTMKNAWIWACWPCCSLLSTVQTTLEVVLRHCSELEMSNNEAHGDIKCNRMMPFLA